MSTNLRTVWVTLRATNYTTAVFTNVISNMNGLSNAQKQAMNSSLNLGKSAMAAGMLFGVLGNQIGGAGGKLLTYASYAMYVVSAFSYMKAGLIALNIFLKAHGHALDSVSPAYIRLGIAMAGITAAFMIFFMLKDTLGVIPALLIAIGVAAASIVLPMMLAAGGLSGLTFGGSAAAGAAAAGARSGDSLEGVKG
jgi:hypothetical protein